MTVKVSGINELGWSVTTNYLIFEENVFEAIRKAIEYADREHNCIYKDGKPTANTYKEYKTITNIEVVED